MNKIWDHISHRINDRDQSRWRCRVGKPHGMQEAKSRCMRGKAWFWEGGDRCVGNEAGSHQTGESTSRPCRLLAKRIWGQVQVRAGILHLHAGVSPLIDGRYCWALTGYCSQQCRNEIRAAMLSVCYQHSLKLGVHEFTWIPAGHEKGPEVDR